MKHPSNKPADALLLRRPLGSTVVTRLFYSGWANGPPTRISLPRRLGPRPPCPPQCPRRRPLSVAQRPARGGPLLARVCSTNLKPGVEDPCLGATGWPQEGRPGFPRLQFPRGETSAATPMLRPCRPFSNAPNARDHHAARLILWCQLVLGRRPRQVAAGLRRVPWRRRSAHRKLRDSIPARRPAGFCQRVRMPPPVRHVAR